jgi:protein-disulfide isomerase
MNNLKSLKILVGLLIALVILNIYATVSLYLRLDRLAARFRPPAKKIQFNKRIPVSVENDKVKGAADAAVTIIEFSDYQCPFSTRFYSQTLPQIEKNYIKTGKAKFVYRDFPLAFHQNAQKAAEATECAAQQGKFWEYHETLFENQKALDMASLKQYAKNLGLDMQRFNGCLDSGKMADEVKKDMADAQKYGVQGTPCFFINGIKVDGAQPYGVFAEIIEKELKKK